MRRAWWFAGILGSAAILGLVAPKSIARSAGIIGLSGNPATSSGQFCTNCHSGGVVPTVVISGSSPVAAGSMNVYVMQIIGGQSTAGGLNVSVDGGTLIASDSGTHTETGAIGPEITHNAPREVFLGPVVFSFTWEAPATPGTYTIYGAGNSVNLNGNFNGDNAATTTLQVVVEGAAGTPGETSDPALQPLLATGYDGLSGDISVSFATGCNTDDNNIYYGPLSLVSTLGFTGEVCDVGIAGTAAFNPGTGSYFFLVVGNQALVEGSYGRDGGSVERSPFVGNTCGEAQDLSASCTP